MNDELKKYALRNKHFDVDWQRQRVSINERIAERKAHPHRGFKRWAVATAAVASIAILAWLGMQITADHRMRNMDIAQFEEDVDEIIAGRLPEDLYVVNGWTDVEVDDWETTPAAYDPFTNAGNGNGN